MSWNYRIFYDVDKATGRSTYSVRTAWYDKKGDSVPTGCGADVDKAYLCSEDLEDLKLDWALMGKAFQKPILFVDGDSIKELTPEDIVD